MSPRPPKLPIQLVPQWTGSSRRPFKPNLIHYFSGEYFSGVNQTSLKTSHFTLLYWLTMLFLYNVFRWASISCTDDPSLSGLSGLSGGSGHPGGSGSCCHPGHNLHNLHFAIIFNFIQRIFGRIFSLVQFLTMQLLNNVSKNYKTSYKRCTSHTPNWEAAVYGQTHKELLSKAWMIAFLSPFHNLPKTN